MKKLIVVIALLIALAVFLKIEMVVEYKKTFEKPVATVSTTPKPRWAEPWADQLEAKCHLMGLDWWVYDYPDETHHIWWAVAFQKGSKYWAMCKQDGGIDHWAYHDGSENATPESAAKMLLEGLDRPPNTPAWECENQYGYRPVTPDPKKWEGN